MPKPKKEAYSQKEVEKILGFLEEHGSIEKPRKPVQVLATEVMLKAFGWPSDGPTSEGYNKTRAILLHLHAKDKLECEWSAAGKRLHSVRLKKTEPVITTPPPVQVVSDKKISDPFEYRKHTADRIEAIRHFQPKGTAKRYAEGLRRGEINESWLHTSLIQLVNALIKEFPKLVLNGNCHRSGRHNPKKGRVDLQDHWGEDVCLRLTTRHPNGQLVESSIIYDSKTSRSDVEQFNENIVLFPGQKAAKLKKAIWASKKYRSCKNLIKEVLDDLIGVEVLPSNLDKETILQSFES